MIIKTASGEITVNKKHSYTKWLLGWISAGGFTGADTVYNAWIRAIKLKEPGCSWYCLGSLMASEQKYGKQLREE